MVNQPNQIVPILNSSSTSLYQHCHPTALVTSGTVAERSQDAHQAHDSPEEKKVRPSGTGHGERPVGKGNRGEERNGTAFDGHQLVQGPLHDHLIS